MRISESASFFESISEYFRDVTDPVEEEGKGGGGTLKGWSFTCFLQGFFPGLVFALGILTYAYIMIQASKGHAGCASKYDFGMRKTSKRSPAYEDLCS